MRLEPGRRHEHVRQGRRIGVRGRARDAALVELGADELLQASLGLAVDPAAERLADRSLVAVGEQHALEDEADVLGRHRLCGALAERPLLAEAASEMQLEAEHLLVAAARERALQADVGDLVLGARVRAAVHVDAHRRLEVAHPILEVGDDPRRDLLGLADREPAELDAGARDRLPAERARAHRRAGRGHLGRRLLDVLVRHVEHEHVLPVREPDAAVAEVLGDPRERDHLLARAGGRAASRRRARSAPARAAASRRRGRASARAARRAAAHRAAARPMRRSSSARTRSTPHSSTRNFERARVRFWRLPLSRKIAVSSSATSMTSSRLANTPRRRPMRADAPRPPPTQTS